MFFNSVSEISGIASKTGTSVFVVPKNEKVEIKGAIILQPEEKRAITIEQVRGVIARLGVKQFSDTYVLIRPADMMNEESSNALLKSLEEPKDKVHFVLVTDSPSRLLPTILSRSAVFILKQDYDLKTLSEDDEKIRVLAKKLISAKPGDLVSISEEIAKKKDGVRNYALRVIGVAIEILQKSYLITGKEIFLKKLPKFLEVYENINKNGHIKLQIVAGLC
ncbi:hypothetical protein IJH72_00680 [Candidatus Saccharibacteria bacterium]|nr:hypothetical protein [Candidatus Saccharibacteria bacterium]